jgi:hypothetical protein
VLDDKTREAVVKVFNIIDTSQIEKSNVNEKNNTATDGFSDLLESKTNITNKNQINTSTMDKSNTINTLI